MPAGVTSGPRSLITILSGGDDSTDGLAVGIAGEPFFRQMILTTGEILQGDGFSYPTPLVATPASPYQFPRIVPTNPAGDVQLWNLLTQTVDSPRYDLLIPDPDPGPGTESVLLVHGRLLNTNAQSFLVLTPPLSGSSDTEIAVVNDAFNDFMPLTWTGPEPTDFRLALLIQFTTAGDGNFTGQVLPLTSMPGDIPAYAMASFPADEIALGHSAAGLLSDEIDVDGAFGGIEGRMDNLRYMDDWLNWSDIDPDWLTGPVDWTTAAMVGLQGNPIANGQFLGVMGTPDTTWSYLTDNTTGQLSANSGDNPLAAGTVLRTRGTQTGPEWVAEFTADSIPETQDRFGQTHNGDEGHWMVTGAAFITGHGVPDNRMGFDNCVYLDADNTDLYVKASGSWNPLGALSTFI